MQREAKKIMEKLNRVQNALFWGLKTWGQGRPGPQGPLDPLLIYDDDLTFTSMDIKAGGPKFDT